MRVVVARGRICSRGFMAISGILGLEFLPIFGALDMASGQGCRHARTRPKCSSAITTQVRLRRQPIRRQSILPSGRLGGLSRGLSMLLRNGQPAVDARAFPPKSIHERARGTRRHAICRRFC